MSQVLDPGTEMIVAPIVRAQALDNAWRALTSRDGPGLEPLSARDGGPLSRAVKLILIPLVLRPLDEPVLGSPVFDEAAVSRLNRVMNDHGSRLRACAAWYVALKAARRKAGLTRGTSLQDLYFQPSYELACLHGHPAAGSPVIADRVVREIDASLSGRSPRDVREALADHAFREKLDALTESAWNAQTDSPSARELSRIESLTGAVLDNCPAPGIAAQQPWDELVAGRGGTTTGSALNNAGPWPSWIADPRAKNLGLTNHETLRRPALEDPDQETGTPPLDRSIAGRVLTVLQHSRDRDALPTASGLLVEETERSACPWGVFDESLRVLLTAGATLARALLDDGAPQPLRAQSAITARWRREASVARARRLAVSADPDAAPELVEVARAAREPWKQYLRRLWVRAHGMDCHGSAVQDVGHAWDLLDGVSRSIVLDHRSRVRDALTQLAGGGPSQEAA